MLINISDSESKQIVQLGNCLATGNIPLKDIQCLLKGLEQKLSAPPDEGKKTRRKLKSQRKAKYAMMITQGIHGNKKLIV